MNEKNVSISAVPAAEEQLTLFQDISNYLGSSHNWHVQLLLWLPTSLFWFALERHRIASPESYTSCVWDGENPDEMQTTSSLCWVKDVLKSPRSRFFMIGYFLILVAFLFTFMVYRNHLSKMKDAAFRLLIIITVVIRCLSSYSGLTTLPNWSTLIWNSNSPGKGVWMWLLVECGAWGWTYLGFYDEYYFDEPTRTVHDVSGRAVWTFTSTKIGKPELDAVLYNSYSPIFLRWRDTAVRLSYIHLIDNTIHVISLRYFDVAVPYTTYINNSEILTIALFFTLAMYTYARVRTHVLSSPQSGPLIDIEDGVPIITHSATGDLFTFNSLHHRFRIPSALRQCCVVGTFLTVMCAIATMPYKYAPVIWMLVVRIAVYFLHVENSEMDAEERKDLRGALGFDPDFSSKYH